MDIPNRPLSKSTCGRKRLTRLNRLKNSAQNCSVVSSLIGSGKFLSSDRSILQNEGPVNVFLPRLPLELASGLGKYPAWNNKNEGREEDPFEVKTPHHALLLWFTRIGCCKVSRTTNNALMSPLFLRRAAGHTTPNEHPETSKLIPSFTLSNSYGETENTPSPSHHKLTFLHDSCGQ